MSFFKSQPHLPKHQVNSLHGAVQLHSDAQFFQGHVGCLSEQCAHLFTVTFEDDWFASCAVMPRCDVATVPPLLDELLDHPERHSEALCDLRPGSLAFVVAGQDAFLSNRAKVCCAFSCILFTLLGIAWLYYFSKCSSVPGMGLN